MKEQVRKVIYVQTNGVDEPERSATPIYLATAAAAMDMEVGIYFTVNGPTLLQKGAAERISPKKNGGAPLKSFIDQARECGVKFYVCQPSLDLNDLKYEDLIDGVEMIGGAAFNDMAVEADQVICF
jgi:predicted peroxiredoxin